MGKGDANVLRAIRLLHTVIWVLFVGCIIAIPVMSWRNNHIAAAVFALIVFAEVIVLAFNKWTCPLTPWAARYTDERSGNFDIFLPEWIARYNKHIFGPLYFAGVVFALIRWLLTN